MQIERNGFAGSGQSNRISGEEERPVSFAIAAARAGIGDLRKDLPKAARTFWTTYVGTVAIPFPNGCGIRADLGDDDIVFLVNGHSRQPSGCHGGPDTDTYRLIGLGSAWAAGSGRTGDATGQSNLFPGAPAVKPPGGLGQLKAAVFLPDGGGTAVATGSSMGTLNQKRVACVDYSGKSGSACAIVMAETSDNGAVWRLNTPEFNNITTQGNTFTLTAPNGATMVATVVEPAQVEYNTGTFMRGGGEGHAGFSYRDKKYINNKWIEFPCEKNVLVVFTLQSRGQAAPRVTGAGTAVKAGLKIGGQTADVDGDKISLSR